MQHQHDRCSWRGSRYTSCQHRAWWEVGKYRSMKDLYENSWKQSLFNEQWRMFNHSWAPSAVFNGPKECNMAIFNGLRQSCLPFIKWLQIKKVNTNTNTHWYRLWHISRGEAGAYPLKLVYIYYMEVCFTMELCQIIWYLVEFLDINNYVNECKVYNITCFLLAYNIINGTVWVWCPLGKALHVHEVSVITICRMFSPEVIVNHQAPIIITPHAFLLLVRSLYPCFSGPDDPNNITR